MTEGRFEYRYIGNRVSTEIDSKTGTTVEGSLHEIEYIKKGIETPGETSKIPR